MGAAVILVMLIFPPWTKITHHAVLALDRSTTLTETQEFDGYSFLFEPPPARGLAAYQTMLMPGEYYESVEIDFGLLFMQWLTAAFLTAAGLLYFKGADKKSLKEWWSSLTAAKSRPATNPPNATPPAGGGWRPAPLPCKVYEVIETRPPQIVMAKIKFLCPHCGQSLQCDESQQGKQVRCPPCGQLFLVPQMPPQATLSHTEKVLRQAPPPPPDLPISKTQVSTDVGSNKASEATTRNQLSPWKRADKAFGFGFFVGAISFYQGNRNNPDLSSSDRMLLAGIIGVVVGLATYFVAVGYYAAKGKRRADE